MPGARPAAAAQPTVGAGEASEAAPAPSNTVQANTTAPALPRESTQTE